MKQFHASKPYFCSPPSGNTVLHIKSQHMAFDFLHYNSFQCPPIATCGCILEEVKSFKFLGVFIPHDLTWMVHCDYIMKKTNRRQLKRCGVSMHDSVMVYCLLVHSILEELCMCCVCCVAAIFI